MNIFSVPLRHSSTRAANPDTGWPMTWITPRTAQINTALTSLSRRWRQRWRAGWLATVFIADQRGERDYLTEHSDWSKRTAIRWIEQDLNARRDEAPLGGPDGWHYVATLARFPPLPKATAYLFTPDQPIRWGLTPRDTPSSSTVADDHDTTGQRAQ